MAPNGSRPVSAKSSGGLSAGSYSTLDGSTCSYFTDRSAVLSLTGGHEKVQRPISGLMNTLIDAAHYQRETRKLVHPPTQAYTLFNALVQDASQQAGRQDSFIDTKGRASTGSASTLGRASHCSVPGVAACLSREGSGHCSISGLLDRPEGNSEELWGTRTRSPEAGATGMVHSRAARPSSARRSAAVSASGQEDLEVVCLYDAHFQTANARGQQGTPLRGLPPPCIGPLSYLFRWYCKRCTQFLGPVTPADVPDAPAMPHLDEPPHVAASSSASVVSRRSCGSMRPPPSAAAPSEGAAAAWRSGGQKQLGRAGSACWAPSPKGVSCSASISGAAPQGAEAAGGIGAGGGGGVGPGRRLQRGVDPVMNLGELTEMLEDLEVVPQLASRADVSRLFHLARAAARSPALASSSSPAPYASAPVSQPGAHVRPDEIRYPAFLDFLVRLALGIAAAGSLPPFGSCPVAGGAHSPHRAASVAPHAPRTGAAVTPPRPPRQQAWAAPGSTSCGGRSSSTCGGSSGGGGSISSGASGGWGRAMSADTALGAVHALLEHCWLLRSDTLRLKQRLDGLARMAGEHGARAAANKLLYVTGPSVTAAAAALDIAAAPPASGLVRPPPAAGGLPLAAGAAGGTGYGSPPPWGVLAGASAPPYLLAVLAAEDRGNEGHYRPAWREFGSLGLDLGLLQPGEVRCCRLMLHARSPYPLAVRVGTEGAPFAAVSYAGLGSLTPGAPKPVDVTVQLHEPGEVVGEIRLRYNPTSGPPPGRAGAGGGCGVGSIREERDVVVPVYGMVVLPQPGGRRGPTTLAERGTAAVRAPADQLLSRAVVAAAALAAPLHRRRSSVGCGPLGAGMAHGSRLGGGNAEPHDKAASSASAARMPRRRNSVEVGAVEALHACWSVAREAGRGSGAAGPAHSSAASRSMPQLQMSLQEAESSV